jgi:hypothetical protein
VPATERNPLFLKENISSTEVKRDKTQLSNAARLRLEDDRGQAEKTGRVTNLNELAQNLMLTFISEKNDILFSFEAGHLYTFIFRSVTTWSKKRAVLDG